MKKISLIILASFLPAMAFAGGGNIDENFTPQTIPEYKSYSHLEAGLTQEKRDKIKKIYDDFVAAGGNKADLVDFAKKRIASYSYNDTLEEVRKNVRVEALQYLVKLGE